MNCAVRITPPIVAKIANSHTVGIAICSAMITPAGMNRPPMNTSASGGLLRKRVSKRLATSGTTTIASRPGIIVTSARSNASSPNCWSRYRFTNTGTDTSPKPTAVNAMSVLLYVRICMIRWYDAPSEIGGAPSVEMTSPIVSFCSNWPRGGSGMKKAAMPIAIVGTAIATKPQRHAEPPPSNVTRPPIASGATSPPKRPTRPCTEKTRARDAIGYASASTGSWTTCVLDRPRPVRAVATKYDSALVTKLVRKTSPPQNNVAMPTIVVRRPESASRPSQRPPAIMNSVPPTVATAITASVVWSESLMSGASTLAAPLSSWSTAFNNASTLSNPSPPIRTPWRSDIISSPTPGNSSSARTRTSAACAWSASRAASSSSTACVSAEAELSVAESVMAARCRTPQGPSLNAPPGDIGARSRRGLGERNSHAIAGEQRHRPMA